MSAAEWCRYESIVQIQVMLAEGYAPVQIKEMLHTTYFRIRRYATGDPFKLCRFQGSRDSEASQYKDKIIGLLIQNIPKKQMLEQIAALGFQGKRTAFEVYCRKLVAELDITYSPRRNSAGTSINPSFLKPAKHYVSRTDFMRYLWSGKELDPSDIDFISSKYPHVPEIQQCILDFRKIYNEKSVALLEQFIEQYSVSTIKPIRSFASGMRGDLDAIKNSITCGLSNGFVEGNNNKIKAIKRTMYGRAKIDLLRVKVLYAR